MTDYTVSSGETSSGLTLSAGDTLSVLSGGTDSATTILSGGSETVGGTDVGATISGGDEFVSFGGQTSGANVLSGGLLELVGGARGATVSFDGQLIVEGGGTATAITITSGGSATISAGGSATGTLVDAGGSELVGGQEIGAIVSGAGATLTVDSIASAVTMSDGGVLRVIGAVFDAVIASGGTESVGDENHGAEAIGTIVLSGGSAVIVDGFDDEGAQLRGGTEVVSFGFASDTTISSGGLLVVSSAGASLAAVIESGGREDVYDVANSTVVGSGGILTTEMFQTSTDEVGVSVSAVVMSGGLEDAFGAGEVTTVQNGGLMIVESGALGALLTVEQGGSATISAGGYNVTGTISGGEELVYGIASAVAVEAGGLQIVEAGGFTSGSIVSASGVLEVFGVGVDATIGNGGSDTVLSGGVDSGTTIRDGGVELIRSDGVAAATMVVSGGQAIVSAGGTIIDPTIAGAGSVINLLNGAAVSGPIDFTDSGGQLAIGGMSMPIDAISGFVQGDTFDLTGVAYDSAGSADLLADNILQIAADGQQFDLHFDPTQNFAGDFFHLLPDTGSGTLVSEDQNPCYCRGTLILTPSGEVPIETLTVGDLVITAARKARPIKWIGRRSYIGRFVLGRPQILPVRIRAGAIADGLPRRDLWVSPNHAVYFDGVLIEARDLINGISIAQVARVDLVEYFHLELDSHDLLVAEGIATESYIDDDNRGMFDNAHEYRALYPGEPVRTSHYCAPRLTEGPTVEQAHALIAQRAAMISAYLLSAG